MVTELSDAMSEESLATKVDITRLERELSVVKWMTSAAAQGMRRLRRTIDLIGSIRAGGSRHAGRDPASSQTGTSDRQIRKQRKCRMTLG